jgi:predicted NAD/FAD-binding protein
MELTTNYFKEYVWLTLFTHHYKAKRGVRDVVERLSSRIHNIHLSAPITDLVPDPDHPGSLRVMSRIGEKLLVHGCFSHVIFATQANSASQLLRTCPPCENSSSLIKCLEKFKYRTCLVVNHTDEAPLPDTRSDWRDLNLVSAIPNPEFCSKEDHLEQNTLSSSYTMTTHILHSQHCRPFLLQTTNPIISIDPSKVLSISKLTRAVLSVEAKNALPGLSKTTRSRWDVTGTTATSLGNLQGLQLHGARIWVCGSYASDGIPLLEGCLKSARAVVEQGVLRVEGARFVSSPW